MATGYSAGADRPLAGVKALVVEDEFVIALELDVALRGLGCVVIGVAASCDEALALLERARPDIGLLDVKLAAGDSGPAAAALRSAGVPFVVVTGYPAEAITDPLLRAAPRLTKPHDI